MLLNIIIIVFILFGLYAIYLIHHVLFDDDTPAKKKKYYREWMMECGWGVMLGYDTVMAHSKWDARMMGAKQMYSDDNVFECITKVKKKHLKLTNDELSKIYGAKK